MATDDSTTKGLRQNAERPNKANALVQQLFARMQQVLQYVELFLNVDVDQPQVCNTSGQKYLPHSAQRDKSDDNEREEIEEAKPSNVIHFIVDFLCKHYPEHLHGCAVIWNADPELERERLSVVEFFRAQKLPTEIASHFTSAGFDTLETLCTLTSESLDDIEKFNEVRWLPGHKVRLQQTFADIVGRVRAFTEERDQLVRAMRNSMHCHHPQLMTKPNLVPASRATVVPGSSPPSSISLFPPQSPVSLGPSRTVYTAVPYGSVYQL